MYKVRFLLKIQILVEAGNKSIIDGSLPKVVQSLLEKLKPEASYFFAESGKRTSYIFFSFNNASEIPAILEPLFMGLNASVELIPVMNAEELKSGLDKASKNF
mgnify:CR=1 FL=1